ncbi:MAG: prephenate dehydratase, partial [Candidatus Bathyarchaeia archaeon]
KYFGLNVDIKPCVHLSDVFRSVEIGDVDSGVVPVENSLEGSVNQTYDLFLVHDLKVGGEVIVKIAHCLIAHPGTRLEDIKAVYSHPQALAQCRNFLEKLNLKVIPTFDTAGSVKMIRDEGLKDAAAIASERAAKIYNMEVLATDIGDSPNNYTRFFVLSKTDAPYTGRDKTSIIFSIKSYPGSLYNILGEFALRDINLTKIESRPTKKTPWEYNFYLDFEGHRTEERCRQALEAIRNKTTFLKVLGSYRAGSLDNSNFHF